MRLDGKMFVSSIVVHAAGPHCQRRSDPSPSKRDGLVVELSAGTFHSAALPLRRFDCLTE
jgi:hypothetical protein